MGLHEPLGLVDSWETVMRLGIAYVYFPEDRRDRIGARQIDEGMVYRALTADADLGEAPPLLVGEWVDRQGRDIRALAQDPGSGRYLEVGFILHDDGGARCYHARTMDADGRRRFQTQRGRR